MQTKTTDRSNQSINFFKHSIVSFLECLKKRNSIVQNNMIVTVKNEVTKTTQRMCGGLLTIYFVNTVLVSR